MIEVIRSEEEILRLIEICENDEEGKILSCARLTLSPEFVQDWIQEGNFKHLKNEVNIYNNIKFGCLKNKYNCQYYFFGSREACYRILNLMAELTENRHTYLKDCQPNNKWKKNKYTGAYVATGGEFNACPLF